MTSLYEMLQKIDSKNPWHNRATSLLKYWFPNYLLFNKDALDKFQVNNPKTFSRFSTVYSGVPVYFDQRNNYTMPHRTCNSSANAMFLVTYFPWLLWQGGDDDFLKTVLSFGDTIYHENQTKALQKFGCSSSWNTDRNLDKLKTSLLNGNPSTVNILHRGTLGNPRGGHIVLFYAYDRDRKEFIYHDPYGSIFKNYAAGSSGVSLRMPESDFKIRWQGGYRLRGKAS